MAGAGGLLIRVFFLAATVFSLSGCQAGYYWHLASGHAELMGDREPVEEVLSRPGLDPETRRRLQQSREMLEFAAAELALEPGNAYRDHVALERDWVVLNLVAAPEFSLEPHQWCYPLLGCLNYRGFFDPERAEREAERLREKGLQVYRGGAIAYSTLGWFADPLTSAMLDGDAPWRAELLFHELTHRRFWLAGDTAFNESLATSVGREGARRWLAQQGMPEQVAVLERRARARQALAEMVADTRERLERIYESGEDPGTMRARRREVILGLRERFERETEREPALARYRDWIQGPLNNAQLNSFSDYNRWVPAFDELLRSCDGRWSCFWGQVERIAALPDEERDAVLENLLPDD